MFGALAPPPYREPAPDGNTYFKVLKPYLALAESYAHALVVKRRYEAIPHPEAKLKARLVGRLVQNLNNEVKAGEVLVARAAEKAITSRIRATRKRPPGKGLLANQIACRPIGTLPFHTAAVGIGDISVLDKVADEQGRPYWAAQEFGSGHLVGKVIHGFFQPGFAAPTVGAFRQHPYFEVDDIGFPMRIRRPIPRKAFLRSGAADAEQFRYRTMSRIASITTREIERILVTNAAGPATKARRGRRP